MICDVDGCERLAKADTICGKIYFFCGPCHLAFKSGMNLGIRLAAGLEDDKESAEDIREKHKDYIARIYEEPEIRLKDKRVVE